MTRASGSTGVYAGSFDPFTNGHTDIVVQAAEFLTKLYVVVAVNPRKSPLFTDDERVEMIQHEIETVIQPALKAKGVTCDIQAVKYSGLTTAFMKANNAPVYVRGLRSDKDFAVEDELLMVNKKEYPELRSLFLAASSPDMRMVSSSAARELAIFGGQSLSHYVSPYVEEKLRKRVIEKGLRPGP